jgi:hypothetical protein
MKKPSKTAEKSKKSPAPKKAKFRKLTVEELTEVAGGCCPDPCRA